jgi:hypothetical protein
MNDIDRWFQRTARREDRTVSLYASLLTGKFFAYLRYRLGYALVLDTARFVIHVGEFLIVLTSFGGVAAFAVMMLRVGSLIISGGWWGFLEVMRERLRTFSQSGDRDAVEREIGRWLVLSVITAVAVLIVGGLALVLLFPSDHEAVGHLYAFLVVVELAVRLPVRVLHSGMFATRRIYRPFWSMIAPTAVQLVVIGAGGFLYPEAAIVIAIIASNALSIWITLRYTLQAYRLTGLWPKWRTRASSLRQLLPSNPGRLGVETTLAGFGLRLDAVVVLVIVGVYGTDTRAFDLTAGFPAWRDVDAFQFFYLVLPLFRGAYDATGVFYFDFVRLRRIPALRQFRLPFFDKLLWTAPVLALFFWSLAVVLGLFVMRDIPFSFLLALLPLFIVRSLIGTYQIRMFAEGQFRALIATLIFLTALLWLVWLDVNPASDLVQITAAMITLLIVHINLQHFQDRVTLLPTLLSLRDWIDTLAGESGPVRVGKIVIPEWISSRQKSVAVDLVKQTFDGSGHFAFRSLTTLVFYERTSMGDAERQPHLALQTLTGGAANRGECLRVPMNNGHDALGVLTAEKWLPPINEASESPDGPEALKSEFLRIFPDGAVLDLETREGRQDIRKLKQRLLAGVLPTATRSLEDGTTVAPVSGRSLSALFHQGKLRLLFILPPEFETELFRSWLRIVKVWHIGGRTTESVSHARER